MTTVQSQYQPEGSSGREIADHAEAAIRAGTLGPGAKLPPIREVATALGTSPTTVAAAYRRLQERGLVVSRGRKGTTVAHRPRGQFLQPPPVPEGVRDLRTGNPSPEFLPDPTPFMAEVGWAAVTGRAEARNEPELLELAGARFAADGIPADHLAVVGGALDGVERILHAHTVTGDLVGVEDPTYPPVADLLLAMRRTAVPIAVDAEGMLPGPFAAAIERGAGAIIVTPRAQNPTGAALTPGRAAELADLARDRPDLLVLEDDHMGEAAGAPAVSIAADPGPGSWSVVRSVSKSLGNDLRLAVVTGDAETIDRLEARQILGTGWVSTILQRLVVAMWSSPEVADLVTEATAAYADRRRRLLGALAERGIAGQGGSGMNVWVPVERESPVVERLLTDGWAVGAGEPFRLEEGPGIRVTVSRLGNGEEQAFAASLAAALASGTSRRSY
jgi:DNA-binding transcriptional MocR family regulator